MARRRPREGWEDGVRYADDSSESDSDLGDAFGQLVDLGDDQGEDSLPQPAGGGMQHLPGEMAVSRDRVAQGEGDEAKWVRNYTHTQSSAWLFGKSKQKRARVEPEDMPERSFCYLCDIQPDSNNRWRKTIEERVQELKRTQSIPELCHYISELYRLNLQPYQNDQAWTPQTVYEHVMRHRPSHAMLLNEQLAYLKDLESHARRTVIPLDGNNEPVPFDPKALETALRIGREVMRVSAAHEKALRDERRGGARG